MSIRGGTVENGISHNPAQDKAQASQRLEDQIRWASGPLGTSAGWMKFMAVLTILGGVFSLFTVFFAIRAIWWSLPVAGFSIWYGILLYSAGSAAESAAFSGGASDLHTALRKTGLYFKVAGITALISLVISVLSTCTAMTMA